MPNPTNHRRTVHEIREFFASALGFTRTRQEILDFLGEDWPRSQHPKGQIAFAGDLIAAGVERGVTQEELDRPDRMWTLTGPNGIPIDEVLREYSRADDAEYNDDADDEQGFVIQSKGAVGRGNFDSNVIGSGRRADIEAKFQRDGGVRFVARRARDGRVGLFRGTGFEWQTPETGHVQPDAPAPATDGGVVKGDGAAPQKVVSIEERVSEARSTLKVLEAQGVPAAFVTARRDHFAMELGKALLEDAR